MATQWLQSYDPNIAAFNSADLHTCRLIVPFAHKLIAAELIVTSVIHTGTVAVSLRQSDNGDGHTGVLVGTALTNATLGSNTSKTTRIPIVLVAADKVLAPAYRVYHFAMSATNSADRVNHPILLLSVDDSPAL